MIDNFHQHLVNRDLSIFIDDVFINYPEQVVTFPLWNLSGRLVGYHTYRPDGPKHDHVKPHLAKYFTFVTKDGTKHSQMTPYGLPELDYSSPIVCLTEGIFDCLTVRRAGFNSLAALTNNPKPLRNLLFMLPFPIIVGVLDGDSAGSKLSKCCTHTITCPPDKDANDMGRDWVRSQINKVIS